MPQQKTIADRILEVVRLNPECSLEELIQGLRELKWCDVLEEVHQLRQSGQLRLSQSSLGLTTLLRVP
mgnify:CR=1 FL=1|jgi:hypothetical protein